jgi:hypothetical protein
VEPKLDVWMDIARTCDQLHAPVCYISSYFVVFLLVFSLSHMILSLFPIWLELKFMQVRIAVVGKYTNVSNAYQSILEVNEKFGWLVRSIVSFTLS